MERTKSPLCFQAAGNQTSPLSQSPYSLRLQVDPPPVSMDEEGQVTLEEDRVSMKGVRLWRTELLFRSEMLTIGVGILIIFIQVAANLYIPQLTQLYQEAMLVASFVLLPSFNSSFLFQILRRWLHQRFVKKLC